MATKQVDRTIDVIVEESAANGERGSLGEPETAYVAEIIGTSPLLMHRYDTEGVKSKGRAAKNSREKKTDDVESFVYRDPKTRSIGVPGKNIVACMREAARSLPDPRSPRKSARDLVAKCLQVEPFMVPLGKSTWDRLDEQRVVIQRAAISRIRPAFDEGWHLKFTIIVKDPEFIEEGWLHSLLQRAGRFEGLLDGRAIGYGLFRVTSFKRARLS